LAFDFIQKMAMSKRMKMRDVAAAVLAGEITP
jgi:AmiR/NasT family two-component response regulator